MQELKYWLGGKHKEHSYEILTNDLLYFHDISGLISDIVGQPAHRPAGTGL